MKSKLKTLLGFVCAVGMLTAVQGQVTAKEKSFSNNVKTHIGKLTFDHGVPTGGVRN